MTICLVNKLMHNNLTAAQLKEQNPEAYSLLVEVFNKLHTDDLEKYMQMYGYVDVNHVLTHYIKYANDDGIISLTDTSGLIFKWNVIKQEWIKSGSLYLN